MRQKGRGRCVDRRIEIERGHEIRRTEIESKESRRAQMRGRERLKAWER